MTPPVTMHAGPLGSTIHALHADAGTVAALAAIDWTRRYRRVWLDPAGGLIALMAPSRLHEELARILDIVVDAAGSTLAGAVDGLRSTRLRRPGDPPGTGMEPDCAFCVTVAALAGIALLCGLLALPWNAPAQTLTVSSWGGLYGESQRKAYFEPFTAATGIRVIEDHWGGDIEKIRAMVAAGRYSSHVLDAESSDVVQGCTERILEPIDYAKLGLSPQDMRPGAAHPCGAGNVAWSMVLVFDHARLSGGGPEGWVDFFDLARFPGGRGLRRGPLGNLEIALMADGVAPEDVYALLRTPAGSDRAFAKLAALAPHVTWWEAGRQPARLLADGDAAMSSAWNGRMQQAIAVERRPFTIVWRGQILDYGYWVIPKDHPRADLAHRFIAFALRPDRQAEQVRHIPYGPSRRTALDHVEPGLASRLPTAPENLERWLELDAGFWIEHREALERRLASLLAPAR